MTIFALQLNTMTTRRVVFSIKNFLDDLDSCFSNERFDLIDDTVQRYKEFLGGTTEELRRDTKKYVNRHSIVTDNQEIKSYIDSCHRVNFEK